MILHGIEFKLCATKFKLYDLSEKILKSLNPEILRKIILRKRILES